MFQQALDKISKQVLIRPTYDNFIGGKFVAPAEGRYFDNLSPITGVKLCQRHATPWAPLRSASLASFAASIDLRQGQFTAAAE